MDMNVNEIIEVLKFDVEMTLFDSNTGEVISEESLQWRRDEATYKHFVAEKKAIEILKEYQQLKVKLSNIVKDIEALASDNNKDLAKIRHKILHNGVLDNGLCNAEESYEAGYAASAEYILSKLECL